MQDENNQPNQPRKGRGRPKKDAPKAAPARPKQGKKGPPMKPENRKLLATRITIERGMLNEYFAGSIEVFAQFLHNQYKSFCVENSAEQNSTEEGGNDSN